MNYIRKNSIKTAKLAEEYLRTNSTRTKMSTIRTLTSFAASGGQDEVIQGMMRNYYIILILIFQWKR